MRRLIVLAVCVLAAGGWAVYRATRPAVPQPPEVPADWADPPLVDAARTGRAVVLSDPHDPAAWGDLGLLFHAHANNSTADACYQVAARLDPDAGRWPYLRAVLARETDPTAAAALCREALTKTLPDAAHTTTVKLTLADLLAEAGQTAEAEAVAREVLSAEPANTRAAYRLAALTVDRGDDSQAITLLRNTARNPFVQQKATALLAGVHRRAGRKKEAAGFEYASSLLPPDRAWPDPHLDPLGGLLKGRQALMGAVTRAETDGRTDDAVDAARRLVDAYPAPATYLLLGRSLVTAGRNEEGLRQLAEALKGDAGLVMAHAFTGIGEFQLGQRAEGLAGPAAAAHHYRRAADALGRAVELKPDYAVGHLYRGRALAGLGRTDEAVQAVRKFIDGRPEEWEGHLTLAELLRAAGRRDEAVAAAERAVAVARPEEPRPRRLLDQIKQGR